MKVIFFGTPEFALPTLRALTASVHEVTLVVTQPDRPRGRHLHPGPPPAKSFALEAGLPVLQPAQLTRDLEATFTETGAQAGVVVAYGLLIPRWLLEVPPFGFLNVHPSLVPRHRGAAPVERALFEGDEETGVSILEMGEGLDDGPIYLQEKLAIDWNDDAGSLRERCSLVGARLMVQTLDRLEKGGITPVPQSGAGVTYAPKLTPEEQWIDWARPFEKIRDRVRALSPRPGASTRFRGRRLKIFGMVAAEGEQVRVPAEVGAAAAGKAAAAPPPGTVVQVGRGGFAVATGSVPAAPLEVQPEGKGRMSAAEFVHGYRPKVGEPLT